MKKKKKINYHYDLFQKNIKKYSRYVNINYNDQKQKININNDLNISRVNSIIPIINREFKLKNNILKNDPVKTIRYLLLPTTKQKQVLQKWFTAYIDMYNCIINKIKNEFTKQLKTNKRLKLIDLKIDLNINKLKKEFFEQKKYLKKKYKINMHILDYAMNDVVAMYKSKISNLKNGHIIKSRLRYLKRTKENKIIKIENNLCTEKSFCASILGKKIKTKPKINFVNEITTVAIIQYNKKQNKYYLLAREHIYLKNNKENKNISDLYNSIKQTDDEYSFIINKFNPKINMDKFIKYNKIFYKKINKKETLNMIKKETLNIYNKIKITSDEYLFIVRKSKLNFDMTKFKKCNKLYDNNKRKISNQLIFENKIKIKNTISNNKNILSLDPGIRTFLTGISDNHVIEIGTNISKEIKKKIKFIDNINNGNKKTKISDTNKKKLVNRTTTKLKNKIDDYHWKIINYLVSNYKHILIGNLSTKEICQNNNIGKMLKRISKEIKLYKFKQRLQYKCYLNGVKYFEVNEYCTSKCCSSCGNFKANLGANKIYNCIKCGLNIDRDINAAKNILVKSIIK